LASRLEPDTYLKMLQAFDQRADKLTTDSIERFLDAKEKDGRIDASTKLSLRLAANEALHAALGDGSPMGPREVYEWLAGHLAAAPRPVDGGKRVLGPDALEAARAEALAGGARIVTATDVSQGRNVVGGVALRVGEVYPWSGPGEFLATMRKRLGTQWHTYPELRRAAIQQFPLTFWNYATPDEQTATLDRIRHYPTHSAFAQFLAGAYNKAPAGWVWPWDETLPPEDDLDWEDIEAARTLAPPGTTIEESHRAAFGSYLENTGSLPPPPPPVPEGLEDELPPIGAPVAP